MTKLPQSGGSYVRNPKTDGLKKVAETKPPKPADRPKPTTEKRQTGENS